MKLFNKVCYLTLMSMNLYAPQAFSADLMAVYHDAILNSPALKLAIADRKVQSHLTSEAMAGFLPKLEAKYDQGYEKSHTNLNLDFMTSIGINATASDSMVGRDFSLQLIQPIFNYKNIIDYQLADQVQIIADQQLVAAEQKLMVGVAKKYFSILSLQDQLTALEAEKKYLTDELTFMHKKVGAGLESQLNTDEVNTELSLVEAERIELESNLRTAVDELTNITGKTYDGFLHLSPKFTPVDPRPTKLREWVDAAQKGNIDLQMESANLELKRKEIKRAGADGLPQVNAVAAYQNYNGLESILGTQKVNQEDSMVGVELKVPIFAGGYYASRQAEAEDKLTYEYARYDQIKNEVYTGTENLFGGIQALIMKIKADESAEKNAVKAVDFATKAYQAGLRGSVDILASRRALYKAESNYSQDLYTYLGLTLELKQTTGILKLKDLQDINALLQIKSPLVLQKMDMM
ncbi:MAG: channel protein TolC [Gammaproteobacteria bacterium]|jgi:outer membrane protein|nr:channel protein TolC [Gammaproteobacteria bacterium]